MNRSNSLLLPERGGVPACCLPPVPAPAAALRGSGTRLVLLCAGSRHRLRNRADGEKQKSHSSISFARFSSLYPSICHPKSYFFFLLQYMTSRSLLIALLFRGFPQCPCLPLQFLLVPPFVCMFSFITVKPFGACSTPRLSCRKQY